MCTTRSSSPFMQPITPCGVASSEVNPNWASWSAGCRVVETGGGPLPEADAVLSDEGGGAWCPDGGYPHHLLLHFPQHPRIRYIGWSVSTRHPKNPRTAEFYSGPNAGSLRRVMKCQGLPGSGVQIWRYPEGIPPHHTHVKVVFTEPFSAPSPPSPSSEDSSQSGGAAPPSPSPEGAVDGEGYGISRIYLFEDEPNIQQRESSCGGNPEGGSHARLLSRRHASASSDNTAGDRIDVATIFSRRRGSLSGAGAADVCHDHPMPCDADVIPGCDSEEQHSPAKTDPKRSPSPPEGPAYGAVRRRAVGGGTTSPGIPLTAQQSRTKLHQAMEGLDHEVRKLHKVRNASPMKAPEGGRGGAASSRSVSPQPAPGVGGGGSCHTSFYEHAHVESRSPGTACVEESVCHPSASRVGIRDHHCFAHHGQRLACVESERDPVWMTIFRSYDDRLARCENQVQRILAILEVKGENERFEQRDRRGPSVVSSSTRNTSHSVHGVGGGANQSAASAGLNFSHLLPEDFPSDEMHALVLSWIKPTMQKWAKQIEKKITRSVNSKVDESFERVTKESIDRKVQEVLDGLSGLEKEALKRQAWVSSVEKAEAGARPSASDSTLLGRRSFHLPTTPSLHEYLPKRKETRPSSVPAAAAPQSARLPHAATGSHVSLAPLDHNSSAFSSPAHHGTKRSLRHELSSVDASSTISRKELR